MPKTANPKSELRTLARETATMLLSSEENLYEKCKSALEQIQALPDYQSAETVVIYSAIADEVDISALLELDKSKRWVMPRAIGEGIMLLFQFDNFDELIEGRYGVKVPPATNHLVHKSEVDLVIVPGLMFDKRGYRLGRGGGYYDRLLSDMRAKSVGVCLAELILEVLPREEHDIAVDYVVAA